MNEHQSISNEPCVVNECFKIQKNIDQAFYVQQIALIGILQNKTKKQIIVTIIKIVSSIWESLLYWRDQ